MRVIAGRFKGRRLVPPPGSDTRPTSDRVREAVFAMLNQHFAGGEVLDLFAGSGALGIEALSRGAADAVFVDSDRRAVAAIERNLEALGIDARVERRDALSFLRHAAAEGRRFGVVFVDPPYSSAPRMAGELSELLLAVVGDDSLIVTESDRRTPLELELPLERERVYGDTRIAIHRVG